MRKPDSVSVVIPSFNCGSFVTQAIDSVLAQTSAPAEVIVVDDGSTDDTAERLKPYRDRIRYVFQENRGVSAARNRAVAESRGNFVAFLDADDVWHPRKLELQLKAFATAPDVGLLSTTTFHWPAFVFPELTEDISDAIIPIPWDDLAVKCRFGTSSVVVRRSTLERAGPFDTELQGPEDRDMWLRIGEVAKVARLNLPLTGYRSVPGSLSRRAATMEAFERRILRKMDERRIWKGRWLLRRKSYSHLTFSCCNM
jgi:glycosyltransferase involved in cell wall biosynthesis